MLGDWVGRQGWHENEGMICRSHIESLLPRPVWHRLAQAIERLLAIGAAAVGGKDAARKSWETMNPWRQSILDLLRNIIRFSL